MYSIRILLSPEIFQLATARTFQIRQAFQIFIDGKFRLSYRLMRFY